MSPLPHDLRFALRTLAQRPGFALTVVFTLALGIGAATVIFDLVNLVAWRRPPVERPQEVVAVYRASQHPFIGPYGYGSLPDYEDYRDASRSLRGLTASAMTRVNVDTGESTRETEARAVTGNFFEVLGLYAALGRVLTAEDDRAGRPPVAVLGYELWRRLGADPDVIGRTVRLAGFPVTVVGVGPEGFRGTTSGSRVGVYFPSHLLPEIEDPETGWLTDRSLRSWYVLGRLAPGATPEQAEAELAVQAERLDREHPIPGIERRVTVERATFGHPIDRRNLRPTVRLFSAAVGLLVLIVCANVANLLLSRAAARRREMGVRQALGAGRRRLVRQLMTESLLLAFAGGVGGLVIAFLMRSALTPAFGEEFVGDMRFDHRVLGLTLLSTLAVTLLFGLAPAIVTSRVSLVSALKDAAASGGGRRRPAAGPLLAVAQVALSLVLLAASAALVGGLWRARQTDLGFDSENLLLARVDVSQGRLSRDQGLEVFRRFEERARALPGVRAAGFALLVPPIFLDVTARLTLPEDPETPRTSRLNYVDAAYFETLGLPLFRGRLFEPRDAASERGVVVVNRTLAEALWPGSDAIGRQVRVERSRPGDPGPGYEVIGVVADVTQHSASRAPEPMIYFNREQRYRASMDLVLRTAGGDPAALVTALREELRRIEPSLALPDVRNHDEHRWNALVEQRLQTQTVALFGLAGLVLALLGIFGVMSYGVSRQVREIGIRMALGARRGDVQGRVLRRALALALWGVGLGIVGAFWASRLLRGAMTGVSGMHPLVLAGTAAVLLLAVAGAAAVPARRASRIDPLTALRYE